MLTSTTCIPHHAHHTRSTHGLAASHSSSLAVMHTHRRHGHMITLSHSHTYTHTFTQTPRAGVWRLRRTSSLAVSRTGQLCPSCPGSSGRVGHPCGPQCGQGYVGRWATGRQSSGRGKADLLGEYEKHANAKKSQLTALSLKTVLFFFPSQGLGVWVSGEQSPHLHSGPCCPRA